jgi:hypothetical protein
VEFDQLLMERGKHERRGGFAKRRALGFDSGNRRFQGYLLRFYIRLNHIGDDILPALPRFRYVFGERMIELSGTVFFDYLRQNSTE